MILVFKAIHCDSLILVKKNTCTCILPDAKITRKTDVHEINVILYDLVL